MQYSLFSLFAFIFFSNTVFSQITYLHCGRLIDGQSDQVYEEVTVVINDRYIEAIESGFQEPPGTSDLIDLRNHTVLPGLMDMHVHIQNQSSKDNYSKGFRMNEADVALAAIPYAEATLMASFTTVRDVGGNGVNISLKKATNAGYICGPRIFTSGKSLGTTGGHADLTNGLRKDLMGDPGPVEGVVNGPDDARKVVRQRYKEGADMIKLTATGGVLSYAKDGSGPQFTSEELEAVVETAKRLQYAYRSTRARSRGNETSGNGGNYDHRARHYDDGRDYGFDDRERYLFRSHNYCGKISS